jgi:hypothetical protein
MIEIIIFRMINKIKKINKFANLEQDVQNICKETVFLFMKSNLKYSLYSFYLKLLIYFKLF